MSRRRLSVAVLMAAGILALGVGGSQVYPPRIVYNASASVPLGYYAVSAGTDLKAGDLVLVRTPESVRGMAAERRYLPRDVPMIKSVQAISGDTVCATGSQITVNGNPIVTRMKSDRLGRPLPWWQGCQTLQDDEVFLINRDAPFSFDGRYFGVVSRALIVGKVRRL